MRLNATDTQSYSQLRTAPQSSDQTFDNPMNKSLKRSSETKKPVRVIRGYKLRSIYGPESGYVFPEKQWTLESGLHAG
jgi:E3 ubiquitin-protein ligase UHRF1